MQKTVRKLLRAIAGYDPGYYDMYADGDESFFARLYLQRILRHLAEAGITPPARILDAGCQAGRLAIPLAQQGFRVTGVDTSRFALARARRHARKAGVSVRWRRADMLDTLRRLGPGRFDAVVCTEVLYLQRNHRAMLEAMTNALRPGGLLCVSHRPGLYYFVESLRHRDLATARQTLAAREGEFPGPFPERGYYNWQTEEELRGFYEGLGLRWAAVYPIDRYSWLSGVRPSRLTSLQRDRWLQLELEPAASLVGRYVLVVAARPIPP